MACVGLFVLVMAPWWLRQLAVFGSISPSTASGKVFFIRDIAEWNSISIPATLDHLLGMGIGPLIASRIGGLVAAVMIYVTLVAGFVLAPFMVIGGWSRRRSLDFGPFFLYAALLFGFSTLVSAIHVPGGTFIHSAVALAPHSYILALEGIAIAVAWVAARRPTWRAESATAAFTGAAIVFAVGAAAVGSAFVHGVWDESRARFVRVAEALDAAGAASTDRVMSIDAAGTKYWSGRGGVVLVNDPQDVIHEVARAYDIRWLVLDREDSVKSMAPVLDGTARPSWLGEPILDRGVAPSPGCLSRGARGMSRESWLSVLGLFAVALVARAVFAGQVVFPKPEDTAYYVGVARNLVEGRGLVSDALWSYGTPPLIFPRPAFEVWMPLPTFLAAIPMLVLGPTFQAAQVSSVLIGATVPVLAWRLAADVAAERGMSPVRARTIALGTGLTSAVYLPLVLHSALPDSTMTFAALVLGACLLMTRVLREPHGGRLSDPRLLGIGVLLGLAALTRNEAAWLALTWVLLVVATRGIERPVKVRMIAIVAVVALIVFAPWALRNWSTFGSPLPGQAVTNAFSCLGLRHLRLERPADPVALPCGRPGPACSRCASKGSPTTSATSCSCRASHCRPSVCWPFRGRPAAARSARWSWSA